MRPVLLLSLLPACSEYALSNGNLPSKATDSGDAFDPSGEGRDGEPGSADPDDDDDGGGGVPGLVDDACSDDPDDRDGDGIPDAEDPFPDHIVTADLHADFDGFRPGTRVLEQYAGVGVHFVGNGSPGEGYDSNVVMEGGDCTTATLDSSPNVLCTWVDDGFNFSGDPGLAGYIDTPADAVTVRLYNAGFAFAEAVGGERDQATLRTYDASGVLLGEHTAIADTSAGEESVELMVMGAGAVSFELYTGDFDAIDDLHLLQLEPCE
jgi:hypothetical protein